MTDFPHATKGGDLMAISQFYDNPELVLEPLVERSKKALEAGPLGLVLENLEGVVMEFADLPDGPQERILGVFLEFLEQTPLHTLGTIKDVLIFQWAAMSTALIWELG